MLASFLNPKLNKQSLCASDISFWALVKSTFSFPWAFLASYVLTGAAPGRWLGKANLHVAHICRKDIGAFRDWVSSSGSEWASVWAQKKTWGHQNQFFLFCIMFESCLWSPDADQIRAFPPAEQVLPLLCSSCVSWLKHPFGRQQTRRSAHVKMTKGRKSQSAHLPFLLAPAMPRTIANNKGKFSQFKSETLLNQKSLLYLEIIQIYI